MYKHSDHSKGFMGIRSTKASIRTVEKNARSNHFSRDKKVVASKAAYKIQISVHGIHGEGGHGHPVPQARQGGHLRIIGMTAAGACTGIRSTPGRCGKSSCACSSTCVTLERPMPL